MAIVELVGKRKDATCYTVGDGYLYVANNSNANTVYLKCVISACRARATMPLMRHMRVSINISTAHNHDADLFAVDELTFRQQLLQRSRQESVALIKIYEEESRRHAVEVIRRCPFVSFHSSMKRERARLQPPLPATLKDFAALLEVPLYLNRFGGSLNGQPYFRTAINDAVGGTAIIFLSPNLKEALTTSKEIHIDGHFRSRPANVPMAQIFTIMAMAYDHAFPAVTVLMEKRNTVSYRNIFEWVKNNVPGFNPRCVISDFERAMQTACREAFPQTKIVGCFFHSAQAMHKRTVLLGIRPILIQNVHAAKAVRMCMALALLKSSQIREGYEEITTYATRHDVTLPLREFFSYVENTWITGVGAQFLSVYRQPRRTNNDHESYHHWLVEKMGHRRHNIWSFVDGLREQEDYYFRRMATVEAGGRVAHERKKKYRLLDKDIRESTRKLRRGRISVLEFLSSTSHRLYCDRRRAAAAADDNDGTEINPAAPPPPENAYPEQYDSLESESESEDPESDDGVVGDNVAGGAGSASLEGAAHRGAVARGGPVRLRRRGAGAVQRRAGVLRRRGRERQPAPRGASPTQDNIEMPRDLEVPVHDVEMPRDPEVPAVHDQNNQRDPLNEVPVRDLNQLTAAEWERINNIESAPILQLPLPQNYRFVPMLAQQITEEESRLQVYELFSNTMARGEPCSPIAENVCSICMEHEAMWTCHPCRHKTLCNCCIGNFVQTVYRSAEGRTIPKTCPQCRAVIGSLR